MGSKGFIGSHFVKYFKTQNIEFSAPDIRTDTEIFSKPLGNIIYAIGVSNFVEKPLEAIDAHVCILKKILEKCNFDSLLYISSGRIYYNSLSTVEDEKVTIDPSNPNDLYNISKIMGESLCLSTNRKNVRVVRPSNVLGIGAPSNLFVPSIIKDAIKQNKIILHSTLESKKDYIFIDDVIDLIIKIIQNGKSRIYNVASGYNIKSQDIINKIVEITNCSIEISNDAKEFSSGQINIDKIKNEFDFIPTKVTDKIEDLIKFYQNSG
ncbi:NAD-dependent epimerase/dehydratase [Candidatus Nitrosopumilus sediminis]|uniref:NAD-dependent epimerase/dehydratase n=1 Tax=Candidatus Nitrosopumilus sediminis TaxID=1229909 RepID=K0BFE6_9ARCH|nr:NAD-dependent epimerase/dehydratase [Candidatus Nitrosopumilus sediminis]